MTSDNIKTVIDTFKNIIVERNNIDFSFDEGDQVAVTKSLGWIQARQDNCADIAWNDGGGDGDESQYYRSTEGVFPIRWTAPESTF